MAAAAGCTSAAAAAKATADIATLTTSRGSRRALERRSGSARSTRKSET
jgi:hypothetical protein